MPDFDNNGVRVHYELVGSGPPLLMIAGLASDGGSWAPLTPLLAERFRVILIDNRGSGRTKSIGTLSIADMVDDAVALLEHLRIVSADIVGHSLGGYIGLAIAAQQPQRVKRLVTLATGGLGPKQQALLDDLARLYFTIPPADWFRLLYQWLFSEPFFANEAALAKAAEASVAYPYRQSPGDFARQLAAVKAGHPVVNAAIAASVLALAAEYDLLAPKATVDAAHAGVANLTRADLPCAHSIHWEATEAVAAAIRDFLG